MILFKEVTKKFGGIVALEDISFKIDKGEFVFLTGPSGAGKTTIIKLILGEYLPTSGEIEVNEKKVNKIPKRKLYLWRRSIGVIFQDYKLLNNRTVIENISLPLQIQRFGGSEIRSRVEKTLALVKLTERAELFPAQLAGGELQRTALARAIITAPEVLLADEPTGNLDPETSLAMVKLFKEINEKGTTILMATHNKDIVDAFKSRVIELDKGKVVRDEKEGKYHKQVQSAKCKVQS